MIRDQYVVSELHTIDTRMDVTKSTKFISDDI